MRKVPLSKKEKRMQRIKRRILRISVFSLGLILAVALGYFVVRYFGEKTVVIDQSMTPGLQKEDVVLMNTLSYKIGSPKRYDVVIVKIGSSEYSPSYVRRVIGLPGETVRISDGSLYINDVKTDIAFNDKLIEEGGVASKGITLSDDSYFVMCDDYNNSHDDSRLDSIGTISIEQIVGSAWLRRSPLSRFGLVH